MRSPDLRAPASPEPIIPSASWPKHYKPYRLFNGCTAKITFDRPHLFETLRCCLIGEVDPCGLRSYEQIGLFRFSVSPYFQAFRWRTKIGIGKTEKTQHVFLSQNFSDFKI
jgi:hypothetical protein